MILSHTVRVAFMFDLTELNMQTWLGAAVAVDPVVR